MTLTTQDLSVSRKYIVVQWLYCCLCFFKLFAPWIICLSRTTWISLIQTSSLCLLHFLICSCWVSIHQINVISKIEWTYFIGQIHACIVPQRVVIMITPIPSYSKVIYLVNSFQHLLNTMKPMTFIVSFNPMHFNLYAQVSIIWVCKSVRYLGKSCTSKKDLICSPWLFKLGHLLASCQIEFI